MLVGCEVEETIAGGRVKFGAQRVIVGFADKSAMPTLHRINVWVYVLVYELFRSIPSAQPVLL
ncbi:MAG: hypothetical protein DWI28_03145 [Planctomycetota bacterium]|nr:MAG: hypothetical protein DWI28_03145 [Planctomycetota bacterium]